MDAITLLKQDHQNLEKLFKRFEQTGDRAHAEQRRLLARITEELSTHDAIEEQLFYPVTREAVPEVEDTALESLEEHHVVKILLTELEHLDPEDERFRAKATVLIENVRHHVEEEEQDYFPKVRDGLRRSALADLGEAMAEARSSAPTHPHPFAPDTPPGNLVTGAAAGIADRLGDTVSGVAQGSVAVAQDLVARVLRKPRPRKAPTGSPTATATARRTRAGIEDAVDHARRTGRSTARSASRRAGATARSASRGASRTAEAAEDGARDTAATARKGAARTRRAAAGSR